MIYPTLQTALQVAQSRHGGEESALIHLGLGVGISIVEAGYTVLGSHVGIGI